MEIKPITKAEKALKLKVIGSTLIHHNIRLQFGLSVEEYILMDFICSINKIQSKPITFSQYYLKTGFIPENIRNIFSILKEKGLLLWDKEKKRVDVCHDWKNQFDSSPLFDQLWKIHAKGNKNSARERLVRVLKKIPFEDLKTKLIQYKIDCKKSERFEKDL